MSNGIRVCDPSLFQRFKRQPRSTGHECIYVPSNTLVKHADLERGDVVVIKALPECPEDLFITVTCPKKMKSDVTIQVMWKDLAI